MFFKVFCVIALLIVHPLDFSDNLSEVGNLNDNLMENVI